MRLLAVETSTLAGGAAVLDGELVVGEYALDVSRPHSERLMGAIDRLLTDAGWTVRDLEGLAVSVGPGSFTGLRIGLSTVKGLALALSIPIVAVPTLDAMAALLPFAALPVCPVLDARKREVYASLYRWDGAGMHRVWEDLAQCEGSAPPPPHPVGGGPAARRGGALSAVRRFAGGPGPRRPKGRSLGVVLWGGGGGQASGGGFPGARARRSRPTPGRAGD